jgi:hypothetical protein
MGVIPHPTMPVGTIRPNDIFLLLAIGATYEFIIRLLLLITKRKPASIKQREVALDLLAIRVRKSRALGPPAFVETSKLERQQLAEEKALSELSQERQSRSELYQRLARNAGYTLSLLVFIMWYGVPVLEFSSDRIFTPDKILTQSERQEAAISSFEMFLFPLSYIGMGIKVSKWGLNNPRASTGALLVMWSAQMTVSKIMDGIDALCL